MQNVWKISWCLGVLAALMCTACRDDETPLKIHVLGEATTHVLGEATRSPTTQGNAALIIVPEEAEARLLRQPARREGLAADDVAIQVAEMATRQLSNLCSDPKSSTWVFKLDKNVIIDCGQKPDPDSMQPQTCTQPPPNLPQGQLYVAVCRPPAIE